MAISKGMLNIMPIHFTMECMIVYQSLNCKVTSTTQTNEQEEFSVPFILSVFPDDIGTW